MSKKIVRVLLTSFAIASIGSIISLSQDCVATGKVATKTARPACCNPKAPYCERGDSCCTPCPPQEDRN